MDCFTVALTDNRNGPRNIFFNPGVNTVDVSELKYLKEREVKTERTSWKLTMMPFKEEKVSNPV